MNYLDELERLRKNMRIKWGVGVSIVCISMLLVIIFGIFIKNNDKIYNSLNVTETFFTIDVFGFAFAIFIVGLFIVAVLNMDDSKKYNKIYKRNVTLDVLNSVFTDIVFEPEKGMDKDLISITNAVKMGNLYDSNDYIKARYKNSLFEGADVHISVEYSDSDGNSRTDTLFRGQWYIFDFNKSFMTNVYVYDKSFEATKSLPKNTYKMVMLEDIDFNKKFEVYAENELDAFYILTPHIIEKIKNISDIVKCSFMFCFINSRLYIGIDR